MYKQSRPYDIFTLLYQSLSFSLLQLHKEGHHDQLIKVATGRQAWGDNSQWAAPVLQPPLRRGFERSSAEEATSQWPELC